METIVILGFVVVIALVWRIGDQLKIMNGRLNSIETIMWKKWGKEVNP